MLALREKLQEIEARTSMRLEVWIGTGMEGKMQKTETSIE